MPVLKNLFSNANAKLKPALLEYIWQRDDIPKVDRLDFMIEVMKQDYSLNAIEYAGRHFTSGANLKIKPLAVDYLVKWWNDHRNELF